MSRVMRKLFVCICENKGTDQLRGSPIRLMPIQACSSNLPHRPLLSLSETDYQYYVLIFQSQLTTVALPESVFVLILV